MRRKNLFRIAYYLAIALAGLLTLHSAKGMVVSMPGRDAPARVSDATYSIPITVFANVPRNGTVALGSPGAGELFRAKAIERTNTVGFGRIPSPSDGTVRVEVPAGQLQARISVSSASAKFLRVGVTFADDAAYSIAAWAPGESVATPADAPSDRKSDEPVWSAITRGETQEIVVTRRVADGNAWSFAVARISHISAELFGGGSDSYLKAFGDSASCQIDLVCVLNLLPTNQQNGLLLSSRSVMLLILTFSNGNAETCTGSLLNSASYPTAIIITANHCITGGLTGLTTLWFYSRATCGSGPPANVVQLVTSGRVLWSSPALDGALLTIDQIPPPPASYTGWDANQPASGTEVLAIHHPEGDVKKATLGTLLGFNLTQIVVEGTQFPPGTFYVVNWQYGIVEHGSSGSGVFAGAGDGLTVRLRGTLTTGSTSCNSSPRLAYYSQLYNMYPLINSFLNSPITTNGIKGAAIEYYHAAFDHYFITAIPDEITKLDNGTFVGWARTNQSFNVYSDAPAGTAPVCRFFSTSFAPKSSHFYTPDATECNIVKGNANWQYEGVVFNIPRPDAVGNCATGTTPVYRLYNNGQGAAPNHRYTTSLTIRSQMLARGWIPEGYGPVGVIMCAIL